jgi:hypothetical protein
LATAVGVVLAAAVVGVLAVRDSPSRTCYGSAALCDLRLDQVALATTHNSMNAAADGFEEPSQQGGIEQQLADGVRGFLVDAFLGSVMQSRDGEVVYTDLTRRRLARAVRLVRPAASERALRIRDRVGPPPSGAPREVYLCHKFCELGAVPFIDVVDQLTRFLEEHDGEVLFIVIQDELRAEQLLPVLSEGGLDPYIATIDPSQPLPTLGSMVESGRRVVIGLENGDLAPRIPNVYDDGLLQETPYDFASVEELEDPASCTDNRGHADAPMFLLNHWVTPPSQDTAVAANSRDVLLGRARRCAQERGQPVNLVAVDFYETGHLFDVVDELNQQALEAD